MMVMDDGPERRPKKRGPLFETLRSMLITAVISAGVALGAVCVWNQYGPVIPRTKALPPAAETEIRPPEIQQTVRAVPGTDPRKFAVGGVHIQPLVDREEQRMEEEKAAAEEAARLAAEQDAARNADAEAAQRAAAEAAKKKEEEQNAARQSGASVSVSQSDVTYLAKVMMAEAGGMKKDSRIAAVGWCILNRVDSPKFPSTIAAVVTAPGQFAWRPGTKVSSRVWNIAENVLAGWQKEKAGNPNSGRVLPKDYLYFYGDGRENHFLKKWRSGPEWNWAWG